MQRLLAPEFSQRSLFLHICNLMTIPQKGCAPQNNFAKRKNTSNSAAVSTSFLKAVSKFLQRPITDQGAGKTAGHRATSFYFHIVDFPAARLGSAHIAMRHGLSWCIQ
ncbi:hypothetical protein COCSUDRAFT_34130 [Coccomyxa subellipsoidea C-169]|uniref:Uncharacterized protein n=1 Tax=Coccomyxa subellipsoidea (strain C-169) TaxID=574566 RepID=I0YNF5_COCSC|nr:hypothetical protein COCSUDRAFT_34130 [Coccomyxa subellipsoidea C-169]EIE19924.1 hypothetical protein COCSUDRAFT_34130 [Coccomyxa subellipsoidea C-169]|eukprot:XP_005644468.1 hypothetical protein COCSUDRAFT_34130 [Coccomyxa subellipsoidea C-169]